MGKPNLSGSYWFPGYHISFLHYMPVCFVPMLITVVLARFSLLGVEMPK
jgi:hypothetical protein